MEEVYKFDSLGVLTSNFMVQMLNITSEVNNVIISILENSGNLLVYLSIRVYWEIMRR